MMADPIVKPNIRAIGLLIVGLAVATIAARSFYFGNPIVHVDEQFYLLAGDRMLHGAVPYIDVWDRKPYGLFLLYAAIRSLGGDGILQYQIAAAIAAAGTTAFIGAWAARGGGIARGAVAGLFYIAMLHKFSGWGGEAEVFLNLFHVLAAWLTWRAIEGRSDLRRLTRYGVLAMASIGIAIQIKTTAVFPGFLFGCMLIWAAWSARASFPAIAIRAVAWAFVAIAPTLAVAIGYAAIGQLDAFLFANFGSVAGRGSDVELFERMRSQVSNIGLPVAIGLGLLALQWRRLAPEARGEAIFLLFWLGACVLAFVSVGAFYNNYALIIAPVAALLLGRYVGFRGIGVAGLVFVAGFGGLVLWREVRHVKTAATEVASYRRMLDVIAANRDSSCLYVYRGYPAYYYGSNSCLPTKFVFPNHLSMATEANALGVDTAAEVTRILATKPRLIMFGRFPSNNNAVTENLVRDALSKDYAPIAVDGPHTLYRRR
jgi:hypothetical protein